MEGVLAELDTAEEEIRTAQEELQAQHDEINRLLHVERVGPWWQGLLVSRLPVAVIVSTSEGTVKSANEAACALLELTQMRLLRKPVQTFIDQGDRARVRTALSEVTRHGGSQTLTCALSLAHGPDRQVQLVLSPTTAIDTATAGEADSAHVCWVLLPASGASAARRGAASLADVLTRLAMLAQGSEGAGYVTEMAEICQEVLGPAASVSITVGPPVEPAHVGSDRKLAQRGDALQMQADQGPCQEAWESAHVIVTNDLAADSRWPGLAHLAAAEHLASVLAIPLLEGGEPIGAINAYATEPDAFADLDQHTAEILGVAVAAVILQVKEHDRLTQQAGQLEDALTSRAVIDQAKGILMARYHCDPDEAFQRLVRVSRNKNIKVRDLAQILVQRTQHHTGPATR